MFKIRNIKPENNIFLAPLSGVSNAAFRLQCSMHGAGLVYSPLMDEDGVMQAFSRFNDFIEEEKPVAGQIVGSNPEKMSAAAKIVEPYVNLIDLNFGCPDKDVLAKKAGAYHIKHPDKIDKIIRSVKEAVKCPVTAKIRIGWDSQTINHIKVSKIIEDAGADAITVHGRTKEQGYSGNANWTAIKQVKEKLSIPVIGNGDANSPEKVNEMFEFTGCDAVMIGRAAMGNPFIFSQTLDYLKTGKYEKTAPYEKLNSFVELLDIYKKHQNRYKFTELRTHALWFTKGVVGASELRQKLLKAEKEEDIRELLTLHLKRIP